MFPLLALAVSASPPVDTIPPRPITQWVHTTWTAKDGAPAEITSLAQTRDGYLWLGGPRGLFRFDGVQFVPFVALTGDSLPGRRVRRLFASRDGTLWIITRDRNLAHLVNGRLTIHGETEGLPQAYMVAESSTGTLVVGTAKGLFRQVDGRWINAGAEWSYPGTESQAVWFDRNDVLWAETENRMVYLPPGGPRFLDPGLPLRRNPVPADFAQTKAGTVWMAEVYRSAHTLPQVGDSVPMSELLVGTVALAVDARGSLWVGSLGDGLRRILDPDRLRGKRIAQFGPEAERFTVKQGLLSDVILAVLADREGGIWVASASGLERFREGAFAPIAIPGSPRARYIVATRDSSLWSGAYSTPGLGHFRSGFHELINRPSFIPRNLVQSRSGELYSANGPVIVRVEGKRFRRVPLRRSGAQLLMDVVVDQTGVVYVVDDRMGLLRLSGDSLVQVAPLNLPGGVDLLLFNDRKNRIWVVRSEGAMVYDQGAVHEFTSAQGETPAGMIGLFEDHQGALWAFSEEGLSRWEVDHFRTLPQTQTLPGRAVYGIAEDQGGAWWLATREGAVRLPPGEADRALADSTHTLRYRTFDTRDGLAGPIPLNFVGPVITRSADDRIWVAGEQGIASVDPRTLPDSTTPAVLIESVRINGRELWPSDTIVIPPPSGDLEIGYTAATLAVPERIQFRYQLEGEDPSWREAGTRRRAFYSRLAPGGYRFKVIASSGDGVWNETGAMLRIQVQPAWYQTLWFRGLLILLLGGLIATITAFIQRRRHLVVQRNLKREYEATLAERARIAQDLHDTLLQGFTGISLQLKTIQLALPNRPELAAETALRLQRLASESLQEARDRVWNMKETAAAKEDLPTRLEAIGRERAIGTEIGVSLAVEGAPHRLSSLVEDAVVRVGREAIVNAIRHAQPHRIEVRLRFFPDSVRLEVHDDGRGFSAAEGDAARRKGHFGVSGMKERAMHMGGSCDVKPRAGGGTIVMLELPLASAEVH